jgi:hypothetical protein
MSWRLPNDQPQGYSQPHLVGIKLELLSELLEEQARGHLVNRLHLCKRVLAVGTVED